MLNLVIGIVVIILGVWEMLEHWMLFKDIFAILLLLGLIAFGIVSFLAGIKKLTKKAN